MNIPEMTQSKCYSQNNPENGFYEDIIKELEAIIDKLANELNTEKVIKKHLI